MQEGLCESGFRIRCNTAVLYLVGGQDRVVAGEDSRRVYLGLTQTSDSQSCLQQDWADFFQILYSPCEPSGIEFVMDRDSALSQLWSEDQRHQGEQPGAQEGNLPGVNTDIHFTKDCLQVFNSHFAAWQTIYPLLPPQSACHWLHELPQFQNFSESGISIDSKLKALSLVNNQHSQYWLPSTCRSVAHSETAASVHIASAPP